MRVENVSDPVYAPNSKGGPKADPERYPLHGEVATPTASSSTPPTPSAKTTTTGGSPARSCVRSWTTPRATGWSSNVVGHLSDGVSEPVLERAFEYWRNIDKETGDRIAKGFNGG